MHELYSRVSQRAYALSERATLRFGKESDRAPALRTIASDTHLFTQPFFGGVNDLTRTVAALRSYTPEDEAEVLARAGRIAQGEVPLLGYGYVNLGELPDWQRDPFVNLAAPLRHWSTIPYLDPRIVGDHKVVWEISRHQYFVTLGQAWQYSRDSRWPDAFVRLVTDWLNSNTPGVGMNWASSLEVSYRAISWVWALHLLRDAPAVSDALRSRMLRSLQAHGRHLERYLSTYFSPNTHLTGEALGLFYIGTQCPELPQAARWAETGATILQTALAKQVLADGVYFEQATQYHRYTIDIYLHYLLLARAAGRIVGAAVVPALNRLFDVLLHVTRADGTYPLIGDDDGGRLVQLDARLPTDVRALLATGAVVLERSDLAWMGRGDDAALCWLLGADAMAARDALVADAPATRCGAFTTGGVYTMRDGWNRDDGLAVIDAGPHGALSYGHSHADALAIDLTVGGEPLFVDAGTFTYVGAERNNFRSTAAHNTIEIDGVSASNPASAFRWNTTADARALSWTCEPEFTYFRGAHDGYCTLPSPVRHERAVLRAAAGLFIIRDVLETTGTHSAVLRWHCAAGVHATPEFASDDLNVLRLANTQGEQALLATFGGLTGAMSVEAGWVSPQFALKLAADVCTWRERVSGNATLASIVIDTARFDIDVEATRKHRLQVEGALAVLTLTAKRTATPEQLLVLVSNGQPITFNHLMLTADITCIRLDSTTGNTLGIIGVGGVTAVVNDAQAALVSVPSHT